MDQQLSAQEQLIYKMISSHIRVLSRDNLAEVSKVPNITLNDLSKLNSKNQDSGGNVCWNLSLLIKMDAIQVVFGCYFSNSAEKDLISNRYKINADEKASETHYKLFGEFCNLTGGGLKRSIHDTFKCVSTNIDKDNNVPLTMSNQFQELMNMRKYHDADCWVLQWNNQYIVCYSYIDINGTKLEEMVKEAHDKKISCMVAAKGGEIELF
ncbi:MAG: hypothetical protein HQK49_06935 [Oligoflexia bacterium]|nr:hypothetical protein [Oligoflexia bacterium]